MKDAVGTLTSFGVNVIEGASNFILGAIGRFNHFTLPVLAFNAKFIGSRV